MPIDLTAFAGTTPYASQLFGVYQPLIGWRGKRGQRRISRSVLQRFAAVVQQMVRDAAFATSGPPSLRGIDPISSLLSPVVGQALRSALREFERESGPRPGGTDWAQVVQRMKLPELVSDIEKSAARHGGVRGKLAILRGRDLSEAELKARGAQEIARTGGMMLGAHAVGAPATSAQAEIASANVLQYLAKNAPNLLSTLKVRPPYWLGLLKFVDPLNLFNPETQDAVLSPLGVVHLYRQHFFELDSFLGPSVGHVWVSPGATVELIEVHQQRVLVERQMESKTLTAVKRDVQTEEEDELATRMNKQSSQDTSIGISARGGFNVGVVSAEASVDVGFDFARQTAQEVAHTHSRRQSELASTELRREFKTTFRTVLETNDKSARSYRIQNATDKLINYELRRKQRRVAVQLQHIDTQLCWQFYVDEPGTALGVAEFVHSARLGDIDSAIQPPEAPQALAAQESEWTVDFPFINLGSSEDTHHVYNKGQSAEGDEDLEIAWTKRVTATVPVPGYRLTSVAQREVLGTNPEEELPVVSAEFAIDTSTADTFQINLNQVNFHNQPSLRFFLVLTWSPPDDSQAQQTFQSQWDEYEERKGRAQHQEYVDAVRERLKLASEVMPRNSADLRAEERACVFDRLLTQLRPGAADESDHVTVELIRSIFDIDRMLYFVAETWWQPRAQHSQQGTALLDETLTEADKIGWGGVNAQGRPNYLITEESLPAPRGASLGWLLQLDGDAHRNAFLNSPFVKAVVPVRVGRESAALEWLKRAEVEGADGLDAPYRGREPELAGKTLEQAIETLASAITAVSGSQEHLLAGDRVFESGFDPLEGGFRVETEPFELFDQWLEVLPTDQVVAVEYTPSVT